MAGQHYNTTGETGDALKEKKRRAKNQEDLIKSILHSYRIRETSPWQVHQMVGDRALITSIRRAMNTLTSERYMNKTNRKRKGPYGNEHVWVVDLDKLDRELGKPGPVIKPKQHNLFAP